MFFEGRNTIVDIVIYKECIVVIMSKGNVVYVVNKKNNDVKNKFVIEKYSSLSEGLFNNAFVYDDKLYISPAKADDVVEIDLQNKIIKYYPIKEKLLFGAKVEKNICFLGMSTMNVYIIEGDAISLKMRYKEKIEAKSNKLFINCKSNKSKLIIPLRWENSVLKLDLTNNKFEKVEIKNIKNFVDVYFEDNEMTILSEIGKILVLDEKNKIIDEYDINPENEGYPYRGIVKYMKRYLLVPNRQKKILIFDKSKEKKYYIEDITFGIKNPKSITIEDDETIFLCNADEFDLVTIDKSNWSIKKINLKKESIGLENYIKELIRN